MMMTTTTTTTKTTTTPPPAAPPPSPEERVRDARACIQRAAAEYGAEGLAVSFNGGKDCTVMLDLFCSTLPLPAGQRGKKWPACYVASPRPFAQVEQFVAECEEGYPIAVARYEGDMKEAFADFLRRHPRVRAILVGVRRTDPHCQDLSAVNATDNGWPAFTRIHPILDWSYGDIWDYLRSRQIPHCSLYDEGFTSIGDQTRTVPNPHLRRPDGCGFYPAHELKDGTQERAGRLPAEGAVVVEEGKKEEEKEEGKRREGTG